MTSDRRKTLNSIGTFSWTWWKILWIVKAVKLKKPSIGYVHELINTEEVCEALCIVKGISYGAHTLTHLATNPSKSQTVVGVEIDFLSQVSSKHGTKVLLDFHSQRFSKPKLKLMRFWMKYFEEPIQTKKEKQAYYHVAKWYRDIKIMFQDKLDRLRQSEVKRLSSTGGRNW